MRRVFQEVPIRSLQEWNVNSGDIILYLTGRPMAGIKYGVPRIPRIRFRLMMDALLEVWKGKLILIPLS
jgi:hypothetical protein